MARTLSTESSCNLIKFVQLGAERIPSCRELDPVKLWQNGIYYSGGYPGIVIREMDASLFHYGPTIRPVGECANIIAFKDTVLSLPQ